MEHTTLATTAVPGYNLREIVAFPRVDDFYRQLMDRSHLLQTFVLRNKYTLFMNALPRKRTRFISRYDNVPLIYAGIGRQRELLEGRENTGAYAHLDQHWNFLDAADLNSDTAVVSSKLYQSFSQGTFRLVDIAKRGSGHMLDYFDAILQPDPSKPEPTPRQLAEYHILKEHFDLSKTYYTSIPLVLFGEFDGILHIVYNEEDRPTMQNPKALFSLIRSISGFYETLIIEWDLVGRNLEKSKAVMLPLEESFYTNINRNPILKELKFDAYYREYLPFYQERIEFNDNLMHSKVYRPYLKTAILSIMIDSYAHNISAHSLVALNWWFKRRADHLRKARSVHHDATVEAREIITDELPEGFDQDRLLELLRPWTDGGPTSAPEDVYDLVSQAGSLDREIQPLIQFLLQKGAFWSGIARDTPFGGESVDLFELLFHDFGNNPLYLGTITRAEGISRVGLRISQAAVCAIRCVKINQVHPVVFSELFLCVDLKHRQEDSNDFVNRRTLATDNETYYSWEEHPELELLSDFVRIGPEYGRVKKFLKSINVFFPGAVVGRHALFTLFENEIRNVKHFRGEALKRMQTEGLELCISHQPGELGPPDTLGDQEAIHRIGIWLNEPSYLYDHDKKQNLLRRKYNDLVRDIMNNKSFSPRLGGGFQDKICAAMLFNGNFSSVQNGDGNSLRDASDETPRDIAYYPWIEVSTAPIDDTTGAEICLNSRNVAEWNETDADQFLPEQGYFKKFFHLWRAADIFPAGQEVSTDFTWENPARFKFLQADRDPASFEMVYQDIKARGVLRAVNAKLPENGEEALAAAYDRWLPRWLGPDRGRLELRMDGNLIGKYVLDRDRGFYHYLSGDNALNNDEPSPAGTVHFAHGGSDYQGENLRYRNHGVFRRYFPSQAGAFDQLPVAEQNLRRSELLEMLATETVIFDNRVHDRLKQENRLNLYRDQLKLRVFGEAGGDQAEEFSDWDDNKACILSSANFLILHLSFIEKILHRRYADDVEYEGENLGLFIDREITPYLLDDNNKIRPNFALVITTGRGRTKWWNRLRDHERFGLFTTFTFFRPIESLISAVEDALSRQDDVELKHNLVKVLFGS